MKLERRRSKSWRGALLVVLLVLPGALPRIRGEEKPVRREEFDRVLRELESLKTAPREPAASSAFSPGRGGLYDKPFLRSSGPRTHVGGYFDVEYIDRESVPHDFRFHRLVPFFMADIHERVKFASEVEIEDGSTVDVEFAFVDFLLVEPVNFRAGVILDPLGRFNLYHDSPLYDLTDRPLVNQFVIPTTLREVGAGCFGVFAPSLGDVQVKYEVYLTSGFKGLSDDPADEPTISRGNGLKDARPHEDAFGTRRFGDNNNNFSGVGRVSLEPTLGSELGLSAHHGAYDEDGDEDLTIAAVDARYTFSQFNLGDVPVGPIEILGEGAYADIERDEFARTEGVPDDLWGYYAQVNYHFLPEYFLPRGTRLTTAFFPDSIFTLVGQWNQVDLDGSRRYRCTVGLNFRPVESTVLKFDYQFNRGTGKAPASADLDAFLISLASYF